MISAAELVEAFKRLVGIGVILLVLVVGVLGVLFWGVDQRLKRCEDYVKKMEDVTTIHVFRGEDGQLEFRRQ